MPKKRATRQKAAVAEALGAEERFMTARELHEALTRAGDAVGLTTVYRALSELAGGGPG